jgi:hypothetical protein
MTDEELQALLPACPQLLKLDCTVSDSWKVVLVAARCCCHLLELRWGGRDQEAASSRWRFRSA